MSSGEVVMKLTATVDDICKKSQGVYRINPSLQASEALKENQTIT